MEHESFKDGSTHWQPIGSPFHACLFGEAIFGISAYETIRNAPN
jgi:hypothetical protein